MRVQLYSCWEDKGDESVRRFRWRIRARNGRVTHASTESFVEARGALKNLGLVFDIEDNDHGAWGLWLRNEWHAIDGADGIKL